MRKRLRQSMKNDADFYFAIFGSANSEHPHLSVDNRGVIKAVVQMVIPKPEFHDILFDVAFQAAEENGALAVREVSIRRSRIEP